MNKFDYIIRLETEKDHRTVEELTREAFWNLYSPGCSEHYFVHTMRSHPDFIPELAFVAEKDNEILANIMYTKAKLISDGEEKDILSFGPLSVDPRYQRMGIGKALIEHSFEVAKAMGFDCAVIFGHPGNYISRGFVSCKRHSVSYFGVYPTAMLVKELVPGVLAGKEWNYVGSSAEEVCEDTEAVEEFDRTFPPKERLVLPSQEEFYIYSHSCIVR